jgi:uncharacterized protein YjcR
MAKKTTVKAVKKEVSHTEIKYAETLYVEKGITPQGIADELGRNIKTIYAWRDKFNWDETKNLFESGPIELKKRIMQEAMNLSKGEKSTIEADAFSKIMKAYDYMSKRIAPEVIRDVFVEFDNFVVSVDPKIANEFTKYHKMFLQHRITLAS